MPSQSIQLGNLRPVALTSRPYGSATEVVHEEGVLYLPDLRLQILANGAVPEESLQYWDMLEFEVERDFQGLGRRYEQPVEFVESDDDVCVLDNFYSRNFLHFVVEELCKVVVLEDHGFVGKYVVGSLPQFAHDALDILGISRDRVISEVGTATVYAGAWYLTPIYAQRAVEVRDVFLHLRERLLASAGDVSLGSDRVWIERRVGLNNQHREIVNREEVDALLERYGFVSLDFAALPLRQQIGAASKTRVLAGPHGAGSVHALFMPRGSDVIECYSPLLIQPGVVEICRIMDHRYSMLVYNSGYEPYPWGDSLMINSSHLELTFSQLGSAQAAR